MQFIHFEAPATLVDRHGLTRPVGCCSILGRHKFLAIQKQILAAISSRRDESWLRLCSLPEISGLIDRALELNGIRREWLTHDQLEILLLHRYDAEIGRYLEPWLVELNQIPGEHPAELIEFDHEFNPEQMTVRQSVAAFSDRLGRTRQITAPSYQGYHEFTDRLKQLKDLARGVYDRTWQELFELEPAFRYACCRCLELAGINPDWVRFDQAEQLLFQRVDPEGNLTGGWLPELLTLPPSSDPIEDTNLEGGDRETLAGLVATMTMTDISMGDAFAAISTVPALLLVQTLRERSTLMRRAQSEAEAAGKQSAPQRVSAPARRITPEEAEALLDATRDMELKEVSIPGF